MNYLEAEDDDHGPVPMEVGAMKGKKGDRGKKGHGKGKFGKSLGKYDKSNEHSKNNDYGKGSEKGKERGKKGKGKGQGQYEKPAPPWRKFRVLPRVQWRRVQRPHLRLRRQQLLFKRSMMSRNQDGSSV